MRVRLVVAAVAVTFLAAACQASNGSREPIIDCSKNGTDSYFVATFDGDATGLPAPSTTLQYGPPGASLDVQAPLNSVQVVDSAAIGSRALRITRPQLTDASTVRAVLGNINDMPNDSGIYYINFKAHGEVIPQPLIAGIAISAESGQGHRALSLKLFDGSYHLLTGGTAGALHAAAFTDLVV